MTSEVAAQRLGKEYCDYLLLLIPARHLTGTLILLRFAFAALVFDPFMTFAVVGTEQ